MVLMTQAMPDGATTLFDAKGGVLPQDMRICRSVSGIIAEAREVGVERIACNGTCEADWQAVWLFLTPHRGRCWAQDRG